MARGDERMALGDRRGGGGLVSAHRHRVRSYYEDTDLSGVVYHANYLKYFERAREHLLGPEELVRLLREEGIGFVVYRLEATYKEGARLGDEIDIETSVDAESDYRLRFRQRALWPESDRVLVDGAVELVCVDAEGKLVRVPQGVLRAIHARGGGD